MARNSSSGSDGPVAPQKDARQERLKRALKANMQRRKAQARARDMGVDDADTKKT